MDDEARDPPPFTRGDDGKMMLNWLATLLIVILAGSAWARSSRRVSSCFKEKLPMRLPRNYVGKNHETIGSDILSVLQVIAMPEIVLGPAMAQKLRAVQADQWYPIGLLLESMELLAAKIGRTGLTQMGRNLFRLTHQEHFLKVASSVGDFAYNAHKMYLAANRGEQIGGWEVLTFEPGLAILENTTPHRCEMEEGLFTEAMNALQLPVMVKQTDCIHKGAASCLFTATSYVKDQRWMGSHPVKARTTRPT